MHIRYACMFWRKMMRMRKLKGLTIVLLAMMISVLLFGLVACGTNDSGNTTNPVIPTPTPNPGIDDSKTLGSQQAWKVLKEAALAAASDEKDSRYINADTTFILGFNKDSYDSLVTMRFAGRIDTQADVNNDTSEILVEFRQFKTAELAGKNLDNETICAMAASGEGKLLMGVYYYEGKLVTDLRGIKKDEGVHVVWTDNIDMTSLVAKFAACLEDLDLSSVLFDTIMGYDIGGLIKSLVNMDIVSLTVEQLIVNILFGASRSKLVDYGNGHTVLQIPCDLGLIVSIIPLVQGLIPENIIGLVKDVLGLDLGKLGALAGMALYLEADMQDGKLNGITFDVDTNLNSYGVEGLQEKYGVFQSEVGFTLGYAKADFAASPDIDVVGTLKSRDQYNQPIQDGDDTTENLYDKIANSENKYSFLTLDGKIKLSLDFAQKTVTVNDVIGSFGTLISNLIKKNVSEDMLKALAPLFEKDIDFAKGTVELSIVLQGVINTKDPAKTRLAVEVRGRNEAKRITAYYDGAKEGVYLDASGVLGSRGTKFKIDDINVNKLIGDLVDKLFATIKGAIKGDSTTNAQYNQLVQDADIVIQHRAEASADGDTTDVMGLISAILDQIDIKMDGNIFNIQQIKVDITQTILNSIFSLVFTGDNAGAKIPVTSAGIVYKNNGTFDTKTIDISADLGVDGAYPLLKAGLGISLLFGNIADEASFNKAFADLDAELAQNPSAYLPILKNGALNTDLLHVNLSTGLSIDIETLKGALAQIKVDLPDKQLGDAFKGVLIEMLLELGNIDGGLNLNVNADLDVSGGLNVAALLNSTAMITVTKKSNGEKVVALYLQDGWLYADIDVLCLSVDKIKVNLSELLTMLGVDVSGGGSTTSALTAEDGENKGMDTTQLLAFVAGLIDGIKVGNHAIEVTLVSGLFDQVLKMLNIEGVTIEFENTDFDGGIRIALNNGLDLTQLQLGVFVALGNNVNLDIAINGLSAGLKDECIKYLDEAGESSDQFVEILEYPFLGLDLTLGIDFTADEGATELVFGKGTHWYDETTATYVAIKDRAVPMGYAGKLFYFDSATKTYKEENVKKTTMSFDTKMNLNYELRLAGQLDLAPIVDYLLGGASVNTKDNVSELMIELTGKKFDNERSILLGVYYAGGALYIDASNFGLGKVKADIDLYELILSLLAKDTTIDINGTRDALTAGDATTDGKKALALTLIASLSSDAFKIEIANGIAQIVYQLLGVDVADITAWVEIAWANLAANHDGKPIRIHGDVNNSAGVTVGSAEIYAKDIDLSIGGQIGTITLRRDEGNLDNGKELGEYLNGSTDDVYEDATLFNEYGDITIPSIFAEIKGTFFVGAEAGNHNWTVGEWIASFLDDSKPELNSFIRQLLLQFSTPVEAGANIGFRIALNARLNPEVPIDFMQNVVFKKFASTDLATLANYVEVYKLVGTKYTLLTLEERANFEGDVYLKQYIAEGIALTKVTAENFRGDAYVEMDGRYVKVTVSDENAANFAGVQLFTTASLLDLPYILSHSDIAIEIYNKNINEIDAMSQAEKVKHVLVALRLVYTGVNGAGKGVSTLFVDLRDDFHVALANISLADLLGGLMNKGNGGTESTAVTSGDGDNKGESGSLLNTVSAVLGGLISHIGVDQSGVKVNFAEALIATLVSMLAGKQVNAEDFIKLNSDESYLSFAWKYNLALKLKIDPAYIGLEISSIKLDLGANEGVLPSDFDQSIYTTAENLDTLSLNLDLRLNLDIKGQKEEVRLEKYLDLLVKDLGLKLGLTFDKDITYKLGLNLGANLALNDPNSTKIVVEIKNVVEDTNIIAIYVSGQKVYVDLGALGRKAFYLENTNVSELVCNKIAKLLGNLNGLVSSTGDAQTAGDAADMSADEKMQVILSIADGKIGVLVMQNVIVGLIAALTSNGSAGDVDIAKMLEAFDLDLSVDVDLQVKPSLSIDVNVDSNLIGLGVSVKAIDLSTGNSSVAYTSVEEKVASEIAKKDYKEITDSSYIGDRYKKEIVDGKVVYVKDDAGTYMPVDHYEALTNAHIVSVDVAMIFDYYGSATYTYIDNERILSSYSPKDRYSKNAHDNRFVQDANGHYVRDGFTFNQLLEVLLNMDQLQSILATMLPQIRISTEGGNISFGKIDNAFSVGDLLTRLGLSLVLSDVIDDGFKLDISAKLDLDAIGLSDLSNIDFKNLNLDVKTILKGLEAKIGVDFTYEDGANSKVKINIYLVDGIVYVDLKGLDGPRVQIDLLDLVKKLGVAISADNDAMTAADQSGNGNEGGSQGGTENKLDIVKILNLVVKNIVLAAKPWEVNPEYNRIDNLGVFVRSNFINDLLSMLFKTKFESANTVVDETQSGIFLRPSSDKFASYGYDEMLTLGLMIALVNKQDPIKDNAGNTKQYTWSLDLGVDAKIDLESVDTYETLLDVDERLEFIALDDYLTNILALVNGFYKDSFQKAEEPVDGTVYYTFHEDPAGQYVKKTGMYRLLNEGEKTEGVTLYSRGYATVVAGVGYELVYTQDTAGDFVFDEEKDVFVRKDAYTGASTTYYRREERAIKKVVDGVVTEENEEIANLALYSKFGVPQYQDQNIALSVSGLIYFNSDSAQSANAGGLISNLFGDMIINLQTLSAFHAGIGLRVSANVDLAALDLKGLLSGEKFDKFIANSDLNKVELAIEFLEVDENGYFAKYTNGEEKVLGGLYLNNGTLYIDLTEIVTTAENYSKIDNFVDFAKKVADKFKKNDKPKDQQGDAQTASDADVLQGNITSATRDALITLAYSDAQFQIQLTRALLAFVISTFMPDLGSIEDVFDEFNISLGVDLGQTVYKKISDLQASNPEEYSKFTDSTNPEYAAYQADRYRYESNVDTYKILPLAKYVLSGGEYYLESETLMYTKDAEGEYVATNAYVDGATYIKKGAAYVLCDKEVEGKYVHATADYYGLVNVGVDQYFNLRSYKMYRKVDGKLVETNTFIKGDTVLQYNGSEYDVLNVYEHEYGYVKDVNGEYYRTVDAYNGIGEYYLGLNIAVGCVNAGLKVGGLNIDFGAGNELLPDYIRDGKAHSRVEVGTDGLKEEHVYESKLSDTEKEKFADVPTNPFYDTIITLGFSVELEFGITEGTLDFGKIISAIVGNLTGIVVEMPSTTKGYSSVHFRLDVSLMLDIYDLTKSELKLELINITETGYESLWAGIYYINNTVYLNLEDTFNIQKVAIGGLNIAEILKDYIIDFDTEEMFVYKPRTQSGSTNEAFVADDSTTSGEVDFTNKDLALALLINKDKLTLALGNILFRTVLEYIPEDLLGFKLKDLFYEEVTGNLKIDLDTSDSINLALGASLGLVGERFNSFATVTTAGDSDEEKIAIENISNGSEKYYVFRKQGEAVAIDSTTSAQTGYFVQSDNKQYFRAITPGENVAADKLYVRYRVAREGGRFVMREVLDNGKGDGSEVLGTKLFKVEAGDVLYKYEKGAAANLSYVGDGTKYDMTLSLALQIKHLNVAFTNSRTYVLSGEDLAEYTNFDDVDRFTISETIDITTSFKTGKDNDIDLSAVLQKFIPGLTQDQLLVIQSVADDGGDVNRQLQLVLEGDIQIAALLNYMRTTLLKYTDGDTDVFEGDMDFFTVIKLLKDVLKKITQTELTALIADVASFVNLKIALQTKGGNDTDFHTMLGVYMVGGTFELLTDAERNDVYGEEYIDPSQRYDHYFETPSGSYYFDETKGEYKFIGASEYSGKRYSYDSSYCYKNEKGNYKRANGGLFIDLSYFNIPSVRVDANEVRKLVMSLVGKSTGETEALTVADGENGGEEGDKKEDTKIEFPLIKDDTILGYIRTFLYGVQITSRYVKALVTPDYINQILTLLMGENAIQFDKAEFENMPNLMLYTDNMRYSYEKLGVVVKEFEAAVERQQTTNPDFLNTAEYKAMRKALNDMLSRSKVLYDIDEYKGTADAASKGIYFRDTDGAYVQKSDMSASQRAAYDAKVVAGTAAYYDINKIDVYIRLLDVADGSLTENYVLYSQASQTQINNCQKYDGLKKFGINTPRLYTLTDEVTGTYTAISDDLYAVNPLALRNSFISLNLYLWNYEISLNILAPKVGVTKFQYAKGSEAGDYDIVSIAQGARYVDTDETLYTSVDKESDGIDNWAFDYGTTFDANKYLANPRYYEYKNKYYVIDDSSLFVKNNGKFELATKDGKTFPDYIRGMIKGEEYFVYTGTSYESIQRVYVYKKEVYNTQKKVLITDEWLASQRAALIAGGMSEEEADAQIDKYDDPENYWIKVQQESSVLQPDFNKPEYKDYAFKEYVDTDDMYYVSLSLRGNLFVNAGKIYFSYNDYEQIYNSLHPTAHLTDSVLANISYKKYHGDYVQVTDATEIAALKENGGLYVWANSVLGEQYDGVNEALGEVLGGLLGGMKGKFQVTEDATLNIYFTLRLNLGFKLYILPKFAIDVRDLDVAIDVWGEQNDKLEGGGYVTREDRDKNNYTGKLLDGSKPHLLGIYYDNDKETGKAGLYLDVESLLGKEAKLYVDMSAYTIEEVIGGLIGGLVANGNQDNADAMTAADTFGKNKDAQDPDALSLFINVFTNSIALNVTSGFLKVIIQELMPDNASIADYLPNLKVYLKQNLNPYDITLGVLLFNQKGDVPVLDLGFNIQGLNGEEGKSSEIQFGRQEDILARQQGENNIFYYANFYRNNGVYEYGNYYGKNFDEKDYVALFKDAAGKDYYATEDGAFKLEGGVIVSAETGYTGQRYSLYNGPEDRFSRCDTLMEEIVETRRYALGTPYDHTYQSIVYTDVNGLYMPVAQQLNNIRSSDYRDLDATKQFEAYNGTLYVLDSNLNYVIKSKGALKGFTGSGNLQYALKGEYPQANASELAREITLNGKQYVPIDPNNDGFTDLFEADGYTPYTAGAIDNHTGAAYVGTLYTRSERTKNGVKYYAYTASNVTTATYTSGEYFYPNSPVKAYKLTTDFTNYTKALSLNIGDILGGGKFDVTSMLADLKSVEIGAKLDMLMTLDDIINWTYQMTKFINDPTICDYLHFIATSLKENKEFQSTIGLDVDLKVYLMTENLFKMLAGDKSVGLLQVLEGAKLYLELTYNTNFHGDKAPKGYLWVEVRNGKLYLNIDVHEIGDIVGWATSSPTASSTVSTCPCCSSRTQPPLKQALRQTMTKKSARASSPQTCGA